MMDFKKSVSQVNVPKPRLIVPIQGTLLHHPDGSVLGVICGHGWVANEDGSPTMRPVINVVVPTDTQRKMVVVLPAEMANVVDGTEEDAPRIVPPV
jgi:hypothetical protein